eukprot:gene30215-35201_t
MAGIKSGVRNLLSEYRLDPDASLENESPQHPWKKIALAVFLLVSGCVLLGTGLGIYLSGSPGGHGIALMVIGCVAFLPGFYHVRIAWMAWWGYKGYTFSAIPDL